MHLQGGDAYKETRATELIMLVVLAQNVADVLAQKALDALARFLHPVYVRLRHLPFHPWPRLERGTFLIYFIIPGNAGHQVFDYGERFHRPDRDGADLGA